MERQPPHSNHHRRRRRLVILLGGIAAALWVVAITLPIVVLVLVDNLPGDDPTRTQRSLTIASGAFLSFALLAIPATIAVIVVHRAQIDGYDT